MGYTHHFSYESMPAESFKAIVKDIIVLRRKAFETLGVESWYDYNVSALTIELNGKSGEDFEPFKFFAGSVYERKPSWFHNPEYFCCKTIRLPYDVIVASSLISMKHHMGHDIRLFSDGKLEEPDWSKAFALYHEAFPDRPPPPLPFFGLPGESEDEPRG